MAKEIEWESVVSGNISQIGVSPDEDNDALFVTFNSGATYAYDGAREEFENLRDAASAGGYFASNIKNRYPARKI